MELGSDKMLRMLPEDEYTHPIEEAVNFNESMYINLFDHQNRMGGWFRVGNRPNEKYAEMSCCLYLPDGRVGFMFKRPEIDNNNELNAGGMKFEIIEPLKKLRVTYNGSLCVLENPYEMADPKKAFQNNPIVKSQVDIIFEACSPIYGGEVVNKDGSPIPEKPGEGFARAHYEQHVTGSGFFKVGDEQWELSGLGLRDHSWGPRYWQSIYWYRWLPMNFSEDFAMVVTILNKTEDNQKIHGMILKGDEYILIKDAKVETNYNDQYYQESFKIWLKDEKGEEYNVDANVVSLIPLRNRRKSPDGEMLLTRITEGMTEYHCNGMVGLGMSEYLDQIIDDLPAGRAC